MKGLLGLIGVAVAGAAIWASHPKGADTPLDGPKITTASPALQGPLTLATIGTSLTARETWPEDLATHLQSCTGQPVTLRRLARGGQTSDWGLANIASLLDAPPDVALIEFTINDADIRRGLSVQDSAINHRALIGVLREANPEVQIILLRLNRAYGIRAMLRPRLATYEQALAEVARIEKVALLDLRPAWAKAGGQALSDGIHPKSEATARLTTPALRDALSLLSGRRCAETF